MHRVKITRLFTPLDKPLFRVLCLDCVVNLDVVSSKREADDLKSRHEGETLEPM